MTDPDADLRALLADAVDGIEPGDRLAAIRAATAGPSDTTAQTTARTTGRTASDHQEKVTTMSSRRSWIYTVTAAAVTTAAVITAVALAGGDGPGESPAPAASSGSAEPSGAPEPSEASPDDETGDETGDAGKPAPQPPVSGEMTVPVYYLGDGADGPVLYREFHRAAVSDGADVRLTAAAREAVAGTPLDPDYRSGWPGVDVRQVTLMDDVITVDLDAAPGRPAGTSAREADLAIQQVVYTVQGAAQQRSPVRFTVGSSPVDSVLGVDTSQPVRNQPLLQTVSRMIITAPFEGQEVSGGSLRADGANNSFEATVAWELRDASGTAVKQGAGIAEGYMAEELFPWAVEVDLGGLDPGTYTFVAMNDDPEGGRPPSDSRAVVLR